MTTIAFDGTLLAADSRVNNGDTSISTFRKLRLMEFKDNEYIIGFAGNIALCHSFCYWYLNKNNFYDKLPKDARFDAIVISKDGNKQVFDDRYPCETGEIFDKYSIGTGYKFAISAMECGKNAIYSVKIASKFDNNTSGNIYCFNTKTWKWEIDYEV